MELIVESSSVCAAMEIEKNEDGSWNWESAREKERLNPHAPVPLDAQNGRINKMYIPGNRCFQTWEGKKKDKLKSPNIFRMATGL